MSPGKMAAQAAHAACLSADWSRDDQSTTGEQLWINWWDTGHYTKFVMEAPDTDRILAIERYLKDREFQTFLVIDEGRTEGTYFQPTALGVQLVDKDDQRIRSIFGEFKLYKDEEAI